MKLDDAVERVFEIVRYRPEGRCYAASEAIYHLAGGKRAGLTPVVHRIRAGKDTLACHWWLRTKDGLLIDVTAHQFRGWMPDYSKGHGCGFLTKLPSKAARLIIRAARMHAEEK